MDHVTQQCPEVWLPICALLNMFPLICFVEDLSVSVCRFYHCVCGDEIYISPKIRTSQHLDLQIRVYLPDDLDGMVECEMGVAIQ